MTTQTTTLTDFLLARLAEDEAAALAASNAPWTASTFYPFHSEVTNGTDIDDGVIVRTPSKDDADAEHIARHDPARVLAEVEAKRRIVEWCSGDTASEWHEGPVLAMLALPYADHPEFDEAWRP